MASLLERVRNVFDNHQDLDRERGRQEGYRAALQETRDALLGSALALKNEWAGELARSQSESYASIHARYEARVQGLNDVFATLRQADPGITTQLHPDKFRESATRQAHTRRQEARVDWALQQDDARNTIGGANRPILPSDRYTAGYEAQPVTEQRKVIAQERSREVSEYGISY